MYKKIDISNEINDLERYNIFSTMMSRIFFTCEVAYSGASTSSVTTDQRTKIQYLKTPYFGRPKTQLWRPNLTLAEYF